MSPGGSRVHFFTLLFHLALKFIHQLLCPLPPSLHGLTVLHPMLAGVSCKTNTHHGFSEEVLVALISTRHLSTLTHSHMHLLNALLQLESPLMQAGPHSPMTPLNNVSFLIAQLSTPARIPNARVSLQVPLLPCKTTTFSTVRAPKLHPTVTGFLLGLIPYTEALSS